jgi:hypothetical protein
MISKDSHDKALSAQESELSQSKSKLVELENKLQQLQLEMKGLEKENHHLSKDLLQSLLQMVEKQLQLAKREQPEANIGQFLLLPFAVFLSYSFAVTDNLLYLVETELIQPCNRAQQVLQSIFDSFAEPAAVSGVVATSSSLSIKDVMQRLQTAQFSPSSVSTNIGPFAMLSEPQKLYDRLLSALQRFSLDSNQVSHTFSILQHDYQTLLQERDNLLTRLDRSEANFSLFKDQQSITEEKLVNEVCQCRFSHSLSSFRLINWI